MKKEVFLSKGMYLYTPVCMGAHAQHWEHQDAYRCPFLSASAPTAPSLCLGATPFADFPAPWVTLADLLSPGGVAAPWFPSWISFSKGNSPCRGSLPWVPDSCCSSLTALITSFLLRSHAA